MACSFGNRPSFSAESAVRKHVPFSITEDVGFGNEVCVLGTHPQPGGGDPLKAPKLVWTKGNVWQGVVELEAGTAFSFSYIRRAYGVAEWASGTNRTVLGTPQSVTSPVDVAPPWGGNCLVRVKHRRKQFE